jgi:hypothetical protein
MSLAEFIRILTHLTNEIKSLFKLSTFKKQTKLKYSLYKSN